MKQPNILALRLPKKTQFIHQKFHSVGGPRRFAVLRPLNSCNNEENTTKINRNDVGYLQLPLPMPGSAIDVNFGCGRVIKSSIDDFGEFTNSGYEMRLYGTPQVEISLALYKQ